MQNHVKQQRGKGRPSGSDSAVGRDALVAAARRLLQELPPAQVTNAAVGREAGADPALIRYYFGSREALLFEVAQQIADSGEKAQDLEGLAPDAQVEALIQQTFRFTRSARYMQRLIGEELSTARSPEVRAKLREWQHIPVALYEQLREADKGRQLSAFDPLFLHLAVIGISDFFHSAEEVVKTLVPEGTDLAALEQAYEAFIARLLLDGLRKRVDPETST
jgi:AcrR family transcriptional regulator